jgi:hypothetical protein
MVCVSMFGVAKHTVQTIGVRLSQVSHMHRDVDPEVYPIFNTTPAESDGFFAG